MDGSTGWINNALRPSSGANSETSGEPVLNQKFRSDATYQE